MKTEVVEINANQPASTIIVNNHIALDIRINALLSAHTKRQDAVFFIVFDFGFIVFHVLS